MTVSRRERPVLVYDGDCAFCTTCAHVLERIGPDAEIVAWQLADLAELGVTEEQATDAVQWAYRLVAGNRYRLPGSTPACAVTDEDRSRPAA